ncbi:non-ribosomal peptide synthetase/type I polyketide synthase [Hydrogenophaga crocea]|uniref:Amino acid adenylation domain-containing protein n=1 Tax=Hydrogenophaga crocea TaxID=2716225 RepID=A0A6G8IFS0_9BURK|nr:non-ribosomal peptide synthetase/type I polyketide synthase [Hydrogenophaga crocea]QIM51885.1 amino acid adenylation domain-containing protein [Hydrogenophaga crocea]
MSEKTRGAAQAGEPPLLGDWLVRGAVTWPERPALEAAGGESFGYQALLARVEQEAARWRQAGIAPGQRMAIAATRSPDSVIAILTAAHLRVGYVPLDLAYPPERLKAMLEDAAPRAVVGEASALQRLIELVGPVPSLQQPAPDAAGLHAAQPDLAYVLFTSGSTGRPKGVAMGERPLRHLIHWHARHARLGQPARTLQFAPLSFDVHFQEIFSTLACGGTLVLVPEAERRDPALLHRALIERSVERLFVPYVALQMIADASREAVPAALKEVVSAGEQLTVTPAIRALFQRLPGAELHNHYGPTESHVVTAHELTGDATHWPEIPPIGLPLPHVQVALHEAQPLEDGATQGELLLGGDTLANGYLGRAELSAERFRRDADGRAGTWYVTGDLVRQDAAGVITYLGRADQQVKVDGFRIEPGEVEVALMAHEAVKEAVVTAPELPGVGKQLVAHVVLHATATPEALAALIGQWRQFLRARMPEYMVPVRYVALERLPMTPSGKIDRRNLPLPVVEAAPAALATTEPRALVRQLWQELLGLPTLADDQNLFDLGAKSLLVMRFVARLREAGVNRVGVADVYDRPSVAGIAAALEGQSAARGPRRSAPVGATQGIAIVGMAVRVPGANGLDAFWQALLEGREGIRHFRPEELDPAVPAELRARPNFVPAHGMLDEADRFDAAHFGISAREATMLDPQQRLMLELSIAALEHAGIDHTRGDDRIGVYAGTGNNAYAPALRQEQPQLVQQYGEFATMLASEKDYVATRIANRLNLRGPAISIHTACSTSLVALTQAWHALASGQCDVALAGGANVHVPQATGYLHVEGGMESADGHCRPFDAQASGTVFGSGGGMVVLRRLEDAIAAGDTVYAVVRGVGINNDGGDKASFTAPSVSGQAEAVRMALDHAGIDPRSIGYVEAHGTGTSLGDPIEIAALTQAWRDGTADNGFCGIGSVKGNVGHLAAGAGVVGLIKATLALHQGTIPATLHFRAPNPQIDFAHTPFHVIAANTPWPRTPDAPRRAAVSSLGVGGTNAHAVLEEAPAARPLPADDGQRWLLPLSARTPDELLARARDLADHLERHPELPLAGVAATLMRGRRAMGQRACAVATSTAEAVQALRQIKSASAASAAPRVVFVFPGQGSQHPGMARGLFDESPAFREALQNCLRLVQARLGTDLLPWLLHDDPKDEAVGRQLAETRHAQPALFAMSYALGAWLESLGIRAQALIGHSIGEYAAACHAGVMSLEDAVAAVVARGQAMFDQPPGAMLAVRLAADALAPRLPPEVEIAGCNAPALTVVAGPFAAIEALAVTLEAQDVGCTRLKVSHAFHSAAMDGALPRVQQALAQARLAAPRVPVYSCVSGEPLTEAQATDPAYWAHQVRAPVLFSKAVSAELAHADVVFVEVGPGQALSALVRQHRTAKNTVPRNLALLGPAQDPGQPAVVALSAIGALWSAGVELAWPVAASAPRVALPGYPFARTRHWFERRAGALPAPVTDAQPVLASAPFPEPPPMPMSRIPTIEAELKRVFSDVSGLPAAELASDATFVDQGLDSLSLTQATLEIERVFGLKLRFRRLLEDLDTVAKLAALLDQQLPPERFAPAPAPAPVAAPVAQAAQVAPAVAQMAVPAMAPINPTAAFAPLAPLAPVAGGAAVHQLIQQQMQLMSQQLALLSGVPAAAVAPVVLQAAPVEAPLAAAPAPAAAQAVSAAPAAAAADSGEPTLKSLVEKPFGASPRLTLQAGQDFTPAQQRWITDFIARYNARTGKSKTFSQDNRKVMADPRVVTGFNPLWKDLVYPIVVDRSKGAKLWDLDGNEYIDLLSCFGANMLGYQPDDVLAAMHRQLDLGLEVGPQHPLSADVARLISRFTGMERVGFCNTGSEAVMGAMRIARTVTGRKKIAIFTNSYHGIFDEVIVRGTRQLRSLSAAPGILANAVENILVLDWNSEESLKVLREHGPQLAAIMTEPIQNKYPNIRPREFVQALRQIADQSGCALIFDEVVTGFRVGRGGAQEFYGVRADIATYGKVIGGGLPFAAIAGNANWLDALDGGHWQYGDDSYPEAGVTYFAGTFVRHPLALAAAHASLLHIDRQGQAFYDTINARTQRMVDRLNAGFAQRGAPCNAVNCASIWRLHWDDGQKNVSLFYYLIRHLGLHVYEQFGHFVTEAMTDEITTRIADTMLQALDELMALGFITRRDGGSPGGGQPVPPLPGSAPAPAGTPAPAAAAGPAPVEAALSPGQTERWLVGAFDDAARRALNESFCVSLRGNVSKPALRQALQDVAQRHAAFHLSFDTSEPRQHAHDPRPVEIAEVDLRHEAEADADAALDAFCTRASQRDFPFDQAPLAAFSLLDLADGRVVVHVVASHLIFDGWASSVFNAELAEAYQARCRGQAPQFKPAESPLAFAEAEQARMDSPQGREALAFWREALKQPPAPVNLGDRSPEGRRQFSADTVRVRLAGERYERLRSQSKARGATLFQWLLTAVTRLIHERSGQPEFVVSIPYASQSLQRHGPLMADGVLDLPLRLSCSAQDSDEALLARVRSHLMDALEYPVMTQGTLARALGLPSRGDRPPLTGIYFNLNPKVDLSAYLPLQAALHEGRKQGILAELFFNFYEQDDALTLDLHHSAEFFSPACAQALVDGLVAQIDRLNGVSAVAKAPAVPASAAPAARSVAQPGPAASADPRLIAWNQATDVPFDVATRVEASVSRQAQATPDATALVAQGVSLSYAALERRANQFAQLLAQRGIGPGALVGVCLARGPELVPALLGILKTGAAYVPLDPNFPKDRLSYMAEDAGLRLVVTEAANAALSGLPREQQLRVDDDRASLDAASDQALPAPHNPAGDAPMYVIYTSGSTGKPKGVVVPQRAVSNFLASMGREPGLKASDRLMAVTTLSFDIAVLEIFLPLVTGATTVLAQRDEIMDAEVLGRLLGEQRINVMQATPTTWHMLLDAGWQAPAGFRALCGGEPLPPSLAGKLLAQGIELWNMYGPTETTVWSTLSRITDAAQKISIGHPIANTQVWVLDEQGKPCAIGQEGELCIGGTGVANGYFKREELTAERFVADPFSRVPGARLYRTGDLARWLDNGTLEHLGRLDFQVKIRGYRIELGEIEARLAALPGIARTVVMAREDTPGDVRLIAYAVPAPGATPEPAALRDALRIGLPDYMVPQQVVLLETLPLLPNGKIDRKALPAPVATAPASSGPLKPPSTDTERTVLEAMQAVLKLPAVGVDEDFFALGGHSLLAAKLMGQLNKGLGLQLNLRVLFESPTVEKLARAIDNERGGKTPKRAPLVHEPERRQAPLTQMQERIRFIEEMQPGRVVYHVPSVHRLRGPMQPELFDRAFQAMVQRQASLRTVIVRDGDTWVQRTLDHVPCSLLPVEDLSELPADQRNDAAMELVGRWLHQPFVLDQAPLFRARLIRLDTQEHLFFFMTHHVVWDGWSFDLLYENMSALYTAMLDGSEPALAPMPLQYTDFAAWHNTWMQSEEIAGQLDHWQRQFVQRPVQTPQADLPRLPGAQRVGATEFMRIESADAERVRDIAKQTGSTLSIVALSVYAVLASQLFDEPQPTIGVPVRGRPHPDLEPIMGFFNNMLPVRLAVRPELTWIEWIKHVRATMVEAFANQDVPFERIAAALENLQPGQHGRLYQALFTFQDARARPKNWGPLTHERTRFRHRGATEDLNFWLVEIPAGIEGGIQYDTGLFLPETAAWLRERFLATFLGLAKQPNQRIADALQATEADRARVLALDAAPVQGPDLLKLLERHSGAAVLRHGERSLSASELLQRVQAARPAPDATDPIDQLVQALAGPDRARASDTVEALAAQVQLLPGDRLLAIGARPGLALALLGLAARQGAELVLLPADAAQRPDTLEALRADSTGLVAADAAAWSALLAANAGRALSGIAVIDVRENSQELMQALSATQASVLQMATDTATGLPLAAGWASGVAQHAVFGRPLLAGTVVVGEAADRPAGLAVAAPLWLRGSDGAWRASGMRARWRADGVLQYLGEDGPHAVLAGERLALDALEKDLAQLPLVARVASALHTTATGERRLQIGIELDASVPDGGVDALMERAGQRLNAALPAAVRARTDLLCLERLASTPDGRLLASASRPRRRAASQVAEHFQGSATEREVFAVWSELLGTTAIRRNDNFFDLGGTSLSAMQAVQRLEKRIGKQVSPRRLVSESLAQLAAAYDGLQAEAPAPAAANPAPADTAPGGLLGRLRRLVQRA